MKQLKELEVGQWYAPCMERLEPKGTEFYELYDVGQLYRYLGEGEFQTQYGELVDGFWDADLQMYVETAAADGFV